MKTARIYIIAGICLIVGIIIIASAFAFGGFDFLKMGSEQKYTEKSFVSSKAISQIKIDDSNVGVNFSKSPDDKIHITYFENDKNYYEITENDDGMLNIIKVNNYKWYDYIFNINFQSISLNVSVPSSFNGKIDTSTSNANIYLKDVNTSDIVFDTSNNKVEINNSSISGRAEIKSSNGEIRLTNSTFGGDLNAKTSNSSITLENISGKEIFSETSNGKINLSSVKSSSNVTARTSNSRISLNNVDAAKKLECKSSNGDISGRVIGSIRDFSIYSHTSNGKSNLPSNMGGGEKVLDISTSNASIDISFSE